MIRPSYMMSQMSHHSFIHLSRESTQINSRENVKVADCPPPAPVQQSEVTQAKKPYVFAYDVPWNEYQYM